MIALPGRMSCIQTRPSPPDGESEKRPGYLVLTEEKPTAGCDRGAIRKGNNYAGFWLSVHLLRRAAMARLTVSVFSVLNALPEYW
jgi:hypothetical protein